MRVLIAGLGSIGRRHARNLARAGVTDLLVWRSLGRPLPAEDEPLPPMQACGSLEEALALRPDAVIVCGPPATHAPVATRAAAAGCHLFVEKPVSHSLEGMSELVTLARASRLVTLVGFNLRFHPGIQLIKSLLDGGRIGHIRTISAQVGQYLPDWHPYEDYRAGYSASRALGGGVILDLIHELDYVRWIAGEPVDVSCVSGRVSDLEIETDDFATVVVRFPSAVATIQLDYLQRSPSRSCRIVGQEGTIVWDYDRHEVSVFTAAGRQWESHSHPGFDRNDMFLAEVRHFLACIEGAETPVVDLEDGIATLRLALAAEQSSRAGHVCRIEREEATWPAFS